MMDQIINLPRYIWLALVALAVYSLSRRRRLKAPRQPPKAISFRVSHFSTSLDPEIAENELVEKLEGLYLANERSMMKPTIYLTPHCYDAIPDEWMAIVTFKSGLPRFLKDSTSLEVNGIHFDRNFYGFTQLYPTNTSPDKTVADIIAVTGLGGHAFGSWVGRETGKMWLRDFLRPAFPNCRVLIYGYDSRLGNAASTETIISFGDTFLSELLGIRSQRAQRSRPIVFIGHSFGGIMISHALTQHGPRYEAIRAATKGLMLFGTPHKGLDISNLRSLVLLDLAMEGADNFHPQLELLNSITTTGKEVVDRTRQLKEVVGQLRILVVTCYETRSTREVVIDSGDKVRRGNLKHMVTEPSAMLELPESLERRIAIPADHTDMVKFDYDDSSPYTGVLPHLRDLIDMAKRHIETKLESQRHIAKYISKLTFETDFTAINDLRTEGTGTWITDDETFRDWKDFKTDKPFLWLFGGPGTGKTFLSTFVIGHLTNHINGFGPNAAVAYVYCKHTQQYDVNEYLRSILRQFATHLPVDDSAIFDKYERSKDLPLTGTELKDCLKMQMAGFRVYIVIDALDESSCPSQLVRSLREILSPRQTRVLITSRRNNIALMDPQHDIECDFGELLCHQRPSSGNIPTLWWTNGQ